MKTIYKQLFILLIGSSVAFVACNKDDDKADDNNNNNNDTEVGTADLEVHFHNKVGDKAFAIGQDYEMMVGGETITYSFDNTAFYVSGITLDKMEGGTKKMEDTYLLVRPEMEHYKTGEVDAVHYTGITFNVGVDSATNHLDPASYAADHPLAPKNPTMHWSWNPGYRFLVLEGKYSSTDGQSGTFVYHIGLDEFLSTVQIDFTEHLMVMKDVEAVIHMDVDFAALLNGIDLRTENFTKSMSAEQKPLAQKIVNNIPGAFSLED